jgi:hypothetical protein
MALINCPECQQPLSTTASSCPRCGAHVRPPERHLKTHTWLASALLVGSYFGLVSQTDERSSGAAVATAIFGALLVIAVIYYVEVRIRSGRRHH